MEIDLSRVLGIEPNSTNEQKLIRRNELLKKYHPDLNSQSDVRKTFSQIVAKTVNVAFDKVMNGNPSIFDRSTGELLAFSMFVLDKENALLDWEEVEVVNSVPFSQLINFVEELSLTSEYNFDQTVKDEVNKFTDFVLLKQSRFKPHFRNFFDSVVTDYEIKMRTPSLDELMEYFNLWNSYQRFYTVSITVKEKMNAYFSEHITTRAGK